MTTRLALAHPVEVAGRIRHRPDPVPVLEPVRQRLGRRIGAHLGPVRGDQARSQAGAVAPGELLERHILGNHRVVRECDIESRLLAGCSIVMARSENIEVATRLRRDILSGTFAPGARLVEAQLTERYGVGRAAVRAAFVELDAEGLIDREANRGASVRQIELDEAIQITEARAALESLIASGGRRTGHGR